MSSFKVISPVDESLVGEFQFSTVDEIFAINYSKPKAISKVAKRKIFDRLIVLLKENKETLAKAITSEMGKPITEARIEIDRTINTVLCCRDFLGNTHGEVVYADSYIEETQRKAIVERVPLGVVLAIVPFNFPLNLCIHKIGPSLIADNLTIIKPNPQNYYSTKLFFDLCLEAGFPVDYLKLICPDVEVLQKLIRSDKVDCISFTGGTKTANSIADIAGRKKLLFELGGNDPLVINKDADLDKACATIIAQRVGTCGQRCTAAKRIFIHEDVYTEVLEKTNNLLEDIIPKNPFEDDCILGPLVTKEAASAVYDLCIENQKLESVNFIKLETPKNAYFSVAIAQIDTLKDNAFYEEIFGPVLAFFKFDDATVDELIAKINSTGYGLQSGVFTNDLNFIQKIHKELHVGSVNINEGPGFRAENIPFGGVSKSGQGREGVKYTYEELTSIKTLII